MNPIKVAACFLTAALTFGAIAGVGAAPATANAVPTPAPGAAGLPSASPFPSATPLEQPSPISEEPAAEFPPAAVPAGEDSPPVDAALAEPSVAVPPDSDVVPTPIPSQKIDATSSARPTDGGAVMGQAGKQAPKPASTLAQPLSQLSEPTVGEQPPGTDGKPLGLDVSGWQKNVNWAAVKNAGARFAYVKTSEGPWTLNDYFGQQYNGAASAGLLRGGYHFARPNLSSGASQAQVMLDSGGGWSADGKTLPPALDIEDNPYVSSDRTNKCYGMTSTALVAWVKDFTRIIKASTGKDAVIYTSYYFWQECFGGSNTFAGTNPLWIAAYYASSPWMPGQWPSHTFWQYANDFADQAQTKPATFPGDQNVFNGSMDELRQFAGQIRGLNYDKPVIGLVPGATLISGKWGGDGKSYVGWFKDGFWCLEMPGRTRSCFNFGSPGDKPVVGDWDGNGTATIGIVRNGSWQLTNNLSKRAVDIVQYFGVGTDTPITGDWDGNGSTTIGIFRNGSWQVTNSQTLGPAVSLSSNFGVGTDTPVVGDWNGDGKDSYGVWRSGSFWLTDSRERPPVDYVFGFGIPTDQPAIGDWDGDGKTTVGIVRGNTWQLTNSLNLRTVDAIRY